MLQYYYRFSEDIDLVLLRDENELNTNLTAKIKKLGNVVSDLLPEVPTEGLTLLNPSLPIFFQYNLLDFFPVGKKGWEIPRNFIHNPVSWVFCPRVSNV